jgi:hypothetical protein
VARPGIIEIDKLYTLIPLWSNVEDSKISQGNECYASICTESCRRSDRYISSHITGEKVMIPGIIEDLLEIS